MNNRKILDFILPTIKRYKFQLISFYICMSFMYHIVPLFVLPYIFGMFGTKYQNSGLTVTNAVFLSFCYALFFSISPLIRVIFVEKRLWYGGLIKMENDFRQKFFEYVMQHSVRYYDDLMSGVIMKKIDKATSTLADTFDNFCMIVSSFIMIVASLIIYLKINFYIAIIFVVWAVLFLFLYYVTSKMAFRARKDVKIETDKLSGIINDGIVNISNIKSFSNQNYEKKLIKEQGIIILHKISNEYKTEAYSRFANGILSTILMLSVIGLSFYLTFKKEIGLGMFIFICQNMVILKGTLQTFYEDTKVFVRNYSEIKESFISLLCDIDIKDREDARLIEVNRGKISFKNITFNY